MSVSYFSKYNKTVLCIYYNTEQVLLLVSDFVCSILVNTQDRAVVFWRYLNNQSAYSVDELLMFKDDPVLLLHMYIYIYVSIHIMVLY